MTAHRDDPRSNERSVTELPGNSGREAKPESKAACPTENPSPLALLAAAMGAKATGVETASVVAEEDEVGAEEKPEEASRRGDRSRDDFFSSTRLEATAAPGANAGA